MVRTRNRGRFGRCQSVRWSPRACRCLLLLKHKRQKIAQRHAYVSSSLVGISRLLDGVIFDPPVFQDLEQLIMASGDYIDKHNANPMPLIWTAKANDILEKVTRAQAASNNRLSA